MTRTGRTVWDRSVVWGILKNPASQGTAAFGKTRPEPLRPRLRAQRNRPVQPRRAVSTSAVPPEDWITIPVPALVEPEVCAAVQEPLQEHKRHARQSRRGALSLRQGLLQCQHCGYAFYGKRLSPSARKGQPRAYASYRCLGTDAYRFGGERVCQHTQVRTDLVDLAVWQAVGTLLAHPERLAEEYRRRLQPETGAKRPPLVTVEGQISPLRQGVARLIDSYADGLMDKHEFEPRMTRLRQRLARLEEQRQHLADAAASHAELQLIIGRLEDFATKVHESLEEADWASKRDLIRTLVKRVEVAQDQVNIVFRIDPYLGDPDPKKKVCNFVGGVVPPPCGVPVSGGAQPPAAPTPACSHGRHVVVQTGRVASHGPWALWAQPPLLSASSLHGRPSCRVVVVGMASSASIVPRPGLNPSECASQRASHAGSRAAGTMACLTRSCPGGRPRGLCWPVS